jgi:hypothetical protein
MSLLELHSRPFVAFDATNKEHRQHYHKFVMTRSWGGCPVRFLVPEDHGDLVTMMQRALIDYYTKKEFGMKLVEVQPKIRPKQKRNG